jgi:hypothetical protein
MRDIPFFLSVPRDKGYTDFVSCAIYLVKMLDYRGASKRDCQAAPPPPRDKFKRHRLCRDTIEELNKKLGYFR